MTIKSRCVLTTVVFLLLPTNFSARPGVAARGTGETESTCQVISRLGFPFGKRNSDEYRELRYALLDICPDAPGTIARPIIQITVGGEKQYREFDLVKFFESRDEAATYAARYGIDDFRSAADDYETLAFARPILRFLKAVRTSDFDLYKPAFTLEVDEALTKVCARMKRATGDCRQLMERDAEGVKKMFGEDYDIAELDFKLIPNKLYDFGSVIVRYRDRAYLDLFEVRKNETGDWKIEGVKFR